MCERGGRSDPPKRIVTITGRIDDGFYVRFSVSYVPSKDTHGLCTKFEPLAGLWLQVHHEGPTSVGNELPRGFV